MSDEITLTLSRADAKALRALFDPRLSWTKIDHHHTLVQSLLKAIDAALAADPAAAPAEGLSFLQKMQKTQAAPTEGPERANLHIRIEKDDEIPAFAGFAYHPDQGDERLVLLNVFASFMAARDAGESVKEIMVESLMHEFGHILEEWFGLEFSEERIEAIVQSYQQANWGYAAPAEGGE